MQDTCWTILTLNLVAVHCSPYPELAYLCDVSLMRSKHDTSFSLLRGWKIPFSLSIDELRQTSAFVPNSFTTALQPVLNCTEPWEVRSVRPPAHRHNTANEMCSGRFHSFYFTNFNFKMGVLSKMPRILNKILRNLASMMQILFIFYLDKYCSSSI